MAPLFLYKFDENTASRRVYDETALKSAKNCGLAALYMVDSDVISFQLVSAAILWVKFLQNVCYSDALCRQVNDHVDIFLN